MESEKEQSAATRSTGRSLRRFGGAVVALAVLVAIAPHVISKTSLRNHMLQSLVGNSDVKVSSGGASFGWFSPLEIDNFRVESSDGSVDIAVEHLSGEKSWLELWLSAPELGKIDFVRPQIKLIVDEQDEEAPDRQLWPSFWAVITNGSLLVRERTQTEPAIDVNRVDIRLQIQRRPAGSVLIVDPIQLVQREALTPDICDQGLQLVAPELSDEVSLEGEYSLRLTGLEYPLGADETDPDASIEGVVTLHQVTAGLKNDVTRRLALLAAELSELGEVPERIRLAENVELAFRFHGGRISHEGMAAFFPELVPGLSIRSTGSVGMDDSLDLQVFMQIPMSAASDSALAGELSKTPIELCVTGTIDEPKLSVPADQPWLSILKEQPSSADEKALAEGLMKALDDVLESI